MASKNLVNEQTKTEKERFTWKIPHFQELVKSPKCIALQKVNFEVGAAIGIPVNFTCFLKKWVMGQRERGAKYLGFCVKLAEPFPPAEVAANVNINLTLEILYRDGMPFYRKYLNEDLEKLLGGYALEFNRVLGGNADEIPSGLLQDDSLSVNLIATIFNLDAKPTTHLNGILANFQERSLQKLRQDLKTLYQEPGSWMDAPTVILCQDGTQLKVNRGIFCVRSPVFRTMFQTEMSEADSGQVKIPEIPSKALDVFLHFVHTGELKNSWKEVGILEGLTYAAHKYELKDLFEFLELALGHLVNQENCGRLMNLAKTLGMVQAEKELMDYFKREVTSIEQAASVIKEAESSLDLYLK